MSTEKTPPLASRKTPIISFSTSGPRNQGVGLKARANKAKMQVSDVELAVFTGGLGKLNNTTNGCLVPTAPTIAIEQRPKPLPQNTYHGSEQLQGFSSDAEPLVHSIEQKLPEPLPGRRDQQLQTEQFTLKPSSQTTRVDYNGSPMPTRHLTNRHISSPSHSSSPGIKCLANYDQGQLISDREDVFPAGADENGRADEESLLPVLPSIVDVSQPSMPPVGDYTWTNTAMNKKQIPSSPRAPSIASALPVHHVYQNGELINPDTEEPIVPSNPQDPFICHGTNMSHFSRLLRNASGKGTKRPAESRANDCSKKTRLSTDILGFDDPDETLVDPPERSRKSKLVSATMAPSSGSSSGSSLLVEVPEKELSPTLVDDKIEDTPSQWKKALQPHQRNVLDVLTQISHQLLAHMIKNENSFIDLIEDFKKGGTLLINHLEKEHEAENVVQAASSETLKQKVLGLYQKTSADLEKNTSKLTARSKGMQKEWRARQESLAAKVDAALALYAL